MSHKPTSSKIGLQFHNLKTGCLQEKKVLKLTVTDAPRRLNYQMGIQAVKSLCYR